MHVCPSLDDGFIHDRMHMLLEYEGCNGRGRVADGKQRQCRQYGLGTALPACKFDLIFFPRKPLFALVEIVYMTFFFRYFLVLALLLVMCIM